MNNFAQDARTWSAEDVDDFCADASPDDAVRVVVDLAHHGDDAALRVLEIFLGTRHEDTYLKAVPSRAAVHALISLGERGVVVLRRAVLDRAERSARYRGAIVEALFRASRGEPLPWAPVAPWVPALEELGVPSEETRTAARHGLRDLVAESMVDPMVFFAMAQFVQQAQLAGFAASAAGVGSDSGEFARAVANLFAEQAIRLSPSLLEEYERLLTLHEREEVYQAFLAQNPVFLDPLSSAVIPKQRLGLEYATDYAIQRLDGRWLLVEIEKPSDRILRRPWTSRRSSRMRSAKSWTSSIG